MPKSVSNRDLTEFVYQAVGEASMCWDPLPGNQVFDSTKAKDVAERILARIADAVAEEREACAKLAADYVMSDGDHGTEIAVAIRARSAGGEG